MTHQPTLARTPEPQQLAESRLYKRIDTHEILHQKAASLASASNIALVALGFDQFVEPPAFGLARCPDLVLTALAVEPLIAASRQAAHLPDHREGRDDLSHMIVQVFLF